MARTDDTAGSVEAAPTYGTARREPVAERADEGGAQAHAGESGQKTRDPAWAGHPLDIRVSFWTPFGRVYLVMLGGPERRAPGRRREERKRHPLLTVNNLFVVIGFAAILVVAAMLGSAGGLYVARWLLAS